jgi:hypothetical protein
MGKFGVTNCTQAATTVTNASAWATLTENRKKSETEGKTRPLGFGAD